ncbi:MAG: DUF1573 domain-containing protein [Alistipes sp.]|jgi:hypothetical protein|nr:DUF1573 domain-containing protein [Alistipes sp.]
MKRIILICLALLATTWIVSAQQPAVIAADNATWDFGEIARTGGEVSHTFVINNRGGMPLVITRILSSCGCTTTQWTREPIPAGGSGSIVITYDPEEAPGPFVKTISVYSNGKAGSYILTVKGDVK